MWALQHYLACNLTYLLLWAYLTSYAPRVQMFLLKCLSFCHNLVAFVNSLCSAKVVTIATVILWSRAFLVRTLNLAKYWGPCSKRFKMGTDTYNRYIPIMFVIMNDFWIFQWPSNKTYRYLHWKIIIIIIGMYYLSFFEANFFQHIYPSNIIIIILEELS